MEFAHSALLWGLLGISIPIAIHLLQLRKYKTVLFSDIRFLKSVQNTAVKQQRIRHWLILATRIIAWTALTLAFALPFFKTVDSIPSEVNRVVIYVDNSPSMSAKGVEGPLWATAVEAANEIVERYPTAKFHIISADKDGQDAFPVNAAGAFDRINEIRPSTHSISLNEVVDRITGYGLTDTALFFSITDLQSASWKALSSTDLPIKWIPYLLQSTVEPENLAVDSVWVNDPVLLSGQAVDVGFSIAKFGEEVLETQIELIVNGEVRGVQSAEIENSAYEGHFTFRMPSTQQAKIEIRVADRWMTVDDSYYAILKPRNHLKFCVLREFSGDQLPWENIESDSTVSVTFFTFSNVPFGELGNYDLIVVEPTQKWPVGLASVLRESAENGSSIAVFPEGPSSEDLAALGIAAYAELDTADLKSASLTDSDPFFSGMFYEKPKRLSLPAIEEYQNIAENYSRLGGSPLIREANGRADLVRYDLGNGQIYQWNSHPVAQHAGWSSLYTPMIYQMAIYKSSTPSISYPLNRSSEIAIEMAMNGDEVLELSQDSTRTIPSQRRIGNTIVFTTASDGMNPGFVQVNKGNQMVDFFAFHPSSLESDVSQLTSGDVESLLSGLGYQYFIIENSGNQNTASDLSALNGPKTQSDYWIYAALVVLLLEMVLWRRPKA